METTSTTSNLSNLEIRFEKALKIIDAIEYLFIQRKILLDSANEEDMIHFHNLRSRYLHQADICEKASERLTKKLLSKNF